VVRAGPETLRGVPWKAHRLLVPWACRSGGRRNLYAPWTSK
jgi:hypothetical protein